MLRWVTLVYLVAVATAAICPMETHQVCNEDDDDHKCLCALTKEQASPPEVSCNTLITRDENGGFPVVSVQFGLNEASGGLEEWPEEKFVKTIADSLNVQKDDIVILRATCKNADDDNEDEDEDEDNSDDDKSKGKNKKRGEDKEEGDKLVVQFGILKKNVNESDIPYEADDFVDADSIVRRMQSMGHLTTQIAGLDVDSIEYTNDLTDIPVDSDNSDLILKASIVGAFFLLTFLLGIWIACRRRGYSDDLQKP